MKRSLLCLLATLFVTTAGSDVVANAQTQNENKKAANRSGDSVAVEQKPVEVPAVLKIGPNSQQRVIELQKTLNKRLLEHAERPEHAEGIDLQLLHITVRHRTDRFPEKVLIADGREFVVPDRWLLETKDNQKEDDPDAEWLLNIHPKKKITPLKVDGIYFEFTRTAVMLFQALEKKRPTGEVDGLALDRLEPLIPPNWLLARLMVSVEENTHFGRKKRWP